MNQNFSEESAIKTEIDVRQLERWQVYQRLTELQVPCRCSSNQPLEVELKTPLAFWQFWTIMWRVSADRNTLTSYLESCWRLPMSSKKDLS